MNKKSPANYPNDVFNIIDAMSFDGFYNVNVVGSNSQRDMLYSADYDCMEKVVREGSLIDVLNTLASQFQDIIRRLQKMKLVFIGDIKCGEVEECDVLKAKQPAKRLDELHSKGIITKEEYATGKSLLGKPEAEDYFKFHILRWTPADVLKGQLSYRGLTITLAQAMEIDAIFKLDVVGFVQDNRFTDFSIIYELFDGDKPINPTRSNIKADLSSDIRYYLTRGNAFKAVKRAYSLARLQGKTALQNKLRNILNSPLGALYQIVSDIDVIVNLLALPKVPIDKIRFEIDQFRGRLGFIYGLSSYEKAEPEYLANILRIQNYQNTKKGREAMRYALQVMADHMADLLNAETMKALQEAKLATALERV